jgi:hypothetical protein
MRLNMVGTSCVGDAVLLDEGQVLLGVEVLHHDHGAAGAQHHARCASGAAWYSGAGDR